MAAFASHAPLVAVLAAIVLGPAACAPPSGAERPLDPASLVERGRYLVTVIDCGGCHDRRDGAGRRTAAGKLAGSLEGFAMPDGAVYYPPNLTPHPGTGLGGWSEAEIVAALRSGRRPDGRVLSEIMPWSEFAALTDQDGAAIVAYLKSLPPVDHAVPKPAPIDQAIVPYFMLHDPGRPRG